MHSMQWYGAGNSMHFPAREGTEIYARLGSLQCIQFKQFDKGMESLTKALQLQHETWYTALNRLGVAKSINQPLPSHQDDSVLATYVPPYALRTLLGTYLSHASCAMMLNNSSQSLRVALESIYSARLLLLHAEVGGSDRPTADEERDYELAAITKEFKDALNEVESQLNHMESENKEYNRKREHTKVYRRRKEVGRQGHL